MLYIFNKIKIKLHVTGMSDILSPWFCFFHPMLLIVGFNAK